MRYRSDLALLDAARYCAYSRVDRTKAGSFVDVISGSIHALNHSGIAEDRDVPAVRSLSGTVDNRIDGLVSFALMVEFVAIDEVFGDRLCRDVLEVFGAREMRPGDFVHEPLHERPQAELFQIGL